MRLSIMLQPFSRWYGSRADLAYVRPWGLAAPILVLIVCLPLLRPLRYPTQITPEEHERMATIQALVERDTLAIDNSTAGQPAPPLLKHGSAGTQFSDQPPTLAFALSGPYWVLDRLGLGFRNNPILASYLLTLLGSTLPVAAAAGLVYRAGRIFELGRWRRTALAIGAVFGSGLVAYATALNARAPAAALLLAACGCLYHAGSASTPTKSGGWLWLMGFTTALSAAIDLGAIAFLALFPLTILVMPWRNSGRFAGLLCYLIGAAGPIAIHSALNIQVTGDIVPAVLHQESFVQQFNAAAGEDELDELPSLAATISSRLVDGLIGPRGVISLFPLLLVGLVGIGAVLRRHWPRPTKMLAAISLIAPPLIMIVYATFCADWSQPMYCVRWYALFLPLIVFWSGALLRRRHHPALWSIALALAAFSIATSLLGAITPLSRTSHEYGPMAAIRQLLIDKAK